MCADSPPQSVSIEKNVLFYGNGGDEELSATGAAGDMDCCDGKSDVPRDFETCGKLPPCCGDDSQRSFEIMKDEEESEADAKHECCLDSTHALATVLDPGADDEPSLSCDVFLMIAEVRLPDGSSILLMREVSVLSIV